MVFYTLKERKELKKREVKINILILEILSAIFLISGLIIYCLPIVSNWLYNEDVKQIKYKYLKEVDNEYNENNESNK